ncbi:MAG: NADPH:quinone oxidoreductase family protein [Rhodobacteraceae bacterium]|nr:NADPH:quinone oxidoreductase family protein [Paracoccaceae bacterium]
MKALQLRAVGEAPVLTDVPVPDPGPGEVQISIAACGLNFADLLMIQGRYQEKPQLPAILGMEVAGVISQVGDGIAGLAPGMRVAAMPGSGGLAEACLAPAERCVRLPDAMSFTDAAAFQIAYGTSHVALDHRAGLKPGETVVVLGAAGGVGLTAVEIAHRMGARVIAVARGADKLAVARAAGADATIDSEAGTLDTALKEMGGVDVVYDAIGDPLGSAALKACRPGGRYLVIGFAAGEVPSFKANYLLVKNLTVHGLYWGGYLRLAPEVLTGSLERLFAWYADGGLRPHVSHVLPLEKAMEGLDLLRSRASTGKVVITP